MRNRLRVATVLCMALVGVVWWHHTAVVLPPPQLNLSVLYTYMLNKHTAPPEHMVPPDPTLTCNNSFNRRILIAALFATEIDILEMALYEYEGIADYYLFENTITHNVREHSKKPIFWPELQKTPRFQRFRPSFHVCNRSIVKVRMWDAEEESNRCIESVLLRVAHKYDVIITGSVDEILSRDNVRRLKHCPLPPLPAGSAIGMPQGKLGRSFKSDWHYPQYPHSFSTPSVHRVGHPPYRRTLAPSLKTVIVGGMHMTHQCNLADWIVKNLLTSDHSHAINSSTICSQPLHVWKQKCYTTWPSRYTPIGPESVTPHILEQNPLRYQEWFGHTVPSEIVLYEKLCHGDHTSSWWRW